MQFGLLGPVTANTDGRAVAFAGAKARAVLAVLLLHRDEAVSAERLAIALWGEDVTPGSVKTVQAHISRLRKALGDTELIASTSEGYRVRVRPGDLDVERFEQLVADGRLALGAGRPEDAAALLREADALWRGPPFGELSALPFAAAEGALLEERRLVALELRIEADLAAGRHDDLVGELQVLTSRYPLREHFHARLMLALYRCGRQADALDAYRRARELLVEEIGIEPGAALREVHLAILSHDPSLAGSAAQQPLPAPPTPLFGRDGDIETVTKLLGQARIVTLVGPGGVGKTRLAIEAASRLAGGFSEGARLVELAPVADVRELPGAIARTLDVPRNDHEPAAVALERFVAARQLLLVLDSFEHLVDGAPFLARLAGRSPGLKFLVTSREPTRLGAERVLPVRPLAVPGPGAPMDSLLQYGAVAMYCDRASAREPTFTLDAGNADEIGEICRRLDGLPLALELAAVWVGLLGADELAARLAHPLDLLAGGPRDAPERHRALRATIDWSFSLLTGEERRAFARMSVFAGGATVETAEAVTEAALATLQALVAKQLLVVREGRLRLLETLREYASERLGQDLDRGVTYERLATSMLTQLRALTPLLGGSDPRWLRRLDEELPNMVAAFSWAHEAGRAELAVALAGELGEFWWRANRPKDGLPTLDAALEHGHAASPRVRAKALLTRARLLGLRHSLHDRADLEAALALYRECGDEAGIAACLGHIAIAEGCSGRFAQARALSEAAIQSARAADERAAVPGALAAAVLVSAEYEEAAARAPAAVAALAAADSLYDLAIVCNVTGYLAIIAERYVEALPWLDRGLLAARRLGNLHAVFLNLGNIGLARLFLGDLQEAADAFTGALAVCIQAGDERQLDETLLGMAAVVAKRGQHARAARLVGAARAHPTEQSIEGEPTLVSRLLEEIVRNGRDRCGSAIWDRAEGEGLLLSVPAAIDLALTPPAAQRTAGRAERGARRA
jgi:predicted ATPase/DNA-binding SARP family transcriptional activator